MPFKKGNKFAYRPQNEEAFDPISVCFNVRKGVRDKLKAVPDWQERLREFVDKLVEEVDKQ
ncbi:hypothetical protein NUACC21_33160 [Scytonema sp. NUACC21]